MEKGYVHLPRAQGPVDLAGVESAYALLASAARAQLTSPPAAGAGADGLVVVAEAGDAAQLCRFEYLAGSSAYIREQLVPRLQGLVETLAGQPARLFKDKCNLKHPGGGGFTPHQDITAYRHFHTEYQVTAAVMLDPATAENGAMEMATRWTERTGPGELRTTPRGQLNILPSYAGGARNGDIVDDLCAAIDWQLVEAAPGDVIVFDSYIPHRSLANRSQNTRRILFFTFSMASDGDLYQDYYAAKRARPNNPIFHVSTPTVHDTAPSVAAAGGAPLRLFTPGPLTTSASVREAACQDIGSRSARAIALTAQLQARIGAIAGCGPHYRVVPLQGSGTFAVEAMLSTMLADQDHVLIVENGVYSQRMLAICRLHQIRHSVLACPHEQGFDLAAVAARLDQLGDVTHVAAVHFETALGVLNDIDGLRQLCRARGCRLLVDAISTFGALPLDFSCQTLCAVALSSNKCLHGLPGLAFVIADQDGLARRTRPRTLVLDLQDQLAELGRSAQWRFTPPLQTMLALEQAIAEFEAAGGQAARLARYAALAQRLLRGMAALGFEPLIGAAHRAPIILTFAPAAGVRCDIARLNDFLLARGIVIYPTKHANPESFRIGVIGELDGADVDRLLAAFAQFQDQRLDAAA